MRADTVGWDGIGLVLGKHSGRHALRAKTEALGYKLTDDELTLVFARFKDLADRKKRLDEADIHHLLSQTATEDYLPGAIGGQAIGRGLSRTGSIASS
jgi:2-isopropylmalate synthase